MMKKYTLILLLMFFYLANAQIKSGIVNYGVTVAENKESKLEKMMLSMNSNYYTITQEFEFKLQFNTEKALFTEEEKLYSDSKAARMGIAKVGVTGVFLIRNDSVYKQGSSRSVGEYIVKKPLSHNWVLLNETKLIDGYFCYKATTENVVTHPEKTFRHSITAWYCPQIPFSFGPVGYGGLPGLILELQTKDAVFGVKKIQLSTDSVEIAELKKFKIYEEEELNDLIEKKHKNVD